MKMLSLILTGLVLGNITHATLIEDGSAFTGNYRAQEEACASKVFDLQTGKTNLVFETSMQGTPFELRAGGSRLPVVSGDLLNAPANSSITQNGGYVSGTEYRLDGVLHFEREGVKPQSFSSDYKIDGRGDVTAITTNTNGSAADNKICHFVRIK